MTALPWRPGQCWTCALPSAAEHSLFFSWQALLGSDLPLVPPLVLGGPVWLDKCIRVDFIHQKRSGGRRRHRQRLNPNLNIKITTRWWIFQKKWGNWKICQHARKLSSLPAPLLAPLPLPLLSPVSLLLQNLEEEKKHGTIVKAGFTWSDRDKPYSEVRLTRWFRLWWLLHSLLISINVVFFGSVCRRGTCSFLLFLIFFTEMCSMIKRASQKILSR